MWFKRVLLGHCAASLAVTIVTASNTKDNTVLRRHHIVERLVFPSRERRQQSVGNQTSSSEIIQLTPSAVTTSSVFASSEASQSSTIINAPTIVITLESTSLSTPTPKASTTRLYSVLSESSSSNGDIPSTSELVSTESVIPRSSTTEQQPSKTPTSSLSTSSRDTTSVRATISTIFDITSTVSSPTGVSQPSSNSEVPSSAPKPSLEPTTTTTSEIVSSEITNPPLFTSTLVPAEGTSLIPSDIVSSSASDSLISSSTIDTASSSGHASTPQASVPQTSSAVLSTPTVLTSETVSKTSPIEQQPTKLSNSSPGSTSNQDPTSTAPEPVGSNLSAVPASLLAEPLTTSSDGQATVSTSFPAVSPPSGPASSSSEEEKFSGSVLQPPTVLTRSGAEISTNVQTFTASGAATSSPMSSAIGPSQTSVLEIVPSVIEISQPVPLTSILDTTATPITSAIQPPLSSGIEQSLSSSLSESTLVISDVSNSLAPSAVPSGQSPVNTASLQLTISSNIEKAPSSSPLEPSLSISQVSSTLSPLVSSVSPAVLTNLSSKAESSFSAPPTSSSNIIPTQTDPSLSGIKVPTSSVSDVVSTDSASLASTGSSFVLTPSPTVVESVTSIATPRETASTGSIGTSVRSSATFGSEITSSFILSETLVTSTIVSTTSLPEASADIPLVSSFLTSTTLGTRPNSSKQSSITTSSMKQSTSDVVTASESQATQSQASSILDPVSTSVSFYSIPSGITLLSSSSTSGSIIVSSQNPTSVAVPSVNTTAGGSIPTSESPRSSSTPTSFGFSSLATSTLRGISYFASSGVSISTNTNGTPVPSSFISNGTQTGSIVPITSVTVTATVSTVYVSSIRSSVLDLSTVAFSLLSPVTGAAVNQTGVRTSSTISATKSSETSDAHIPASESLKSSTKLGLGANPTWSTLARSSLTPTGLPVRINSTTTTKEELGITFSRSALPTSASTGIAPSLYATQAETLQKSSVPAAVNSTTAGFVASTISGSASSAQTDISSSTSASGSDEASTTNGANTDDTKISATAHAPTSTPSQTTAAGSPPPFTTSQTAGVAVGATTGLLIAVVAAVFIARRYHAAKHGKRMNTGSVYPKVAYLYDPKMGGDGGDAEALIFGATGGMPPGGPISRSAQGSPEHMQRHSTGTMPVTRFISPGNPFRESVRDRANHRYSEYARIDTARALSAAVAGYDCAPKHSSSYTKYPSDVTSIFSDHVIPSPTFSPFSPDDIRRPELKTPQSADDGRAEYSQMPVNPYAYLNTAASMYPPVSPYGRPPTQGLSPTYDTRRQTMDSDSFADPFEHDLLLQVDERNRTSDSVTVFAASPNLMSPRTPRTPVGPKLPVRQPNGMNSARSLLSPVAARYMHKAKEVKIPRKSIVSPVLVQVGRSPMIKPFSPPPAAPEPLGWEDIKRHSEKRFSDKRSVPAPLRFASRVIKKKPGPTSHTSTEPFLTGAGQALLAGNGLPLTVTIPHMYNKSAGLDVPRVHGRPDPAHEDVSSDPVVREKRSRELRFADPALIGKEF